jgi:hypothetical protein
MNPDHPSETDQRVHRRSRRVRTNWGLAVVLVLSVSGLGIVAAQGVASASKTSTTHSAKKSLKMFDSCLKKHGVKISFPGTGGPPKGGAPSGKVPPAGGATGGGAPSGFKGGAKTQKALKACSKFLPAGSQFGGAPGSGGGTPTNLSTEFAAFRNCMTLKHVTLAKGAYGNTEKSTSVTSTSSSTYKKAYSACSSLLPKAPAKSG